MRKALLLIFMAMFLTGCGVLTPKEVVVIQHVVVAPADNLLVDCDVQAPPTKAVYLQNYSIESNNISILQDADWHLTRYINMLKAADRRERLLMETNTKNYEYIDVCNQRWAKLREWKVEAMKLSTKKKE